MNKPDDVSKAIVETAGAATDVVVAAVKNPLKTAELVITTPIKVADSILNSLFGFGR